MKRLTVFCVLVSLLYLPSIATAGTKEEIMRLQRDVLALQNQIREFEKSFNERTDGLKSLVVQLNDQVAKSNLLLDRVSKTMDNQASGAKSTDQAVLQELRNLSGKMDDAATRISALAQQITDLKVQSKPIFESSGTATESDQALYDRAFGDYVQGNFDLAIQGFNDYLRSYPSGARLADVQFYLGDSYVAQNKIQEAIRAFSRVINDFPESPKVPSALFKRATAEIAAQETDSAIMDFKDIIQRFPDSPEASRAQSELRNLSPTTRKPAPAKPARRR